MPVIEKTGLSYASTKDGVMHEVPGSLTERDPVNLGCRAAAQRRLPKRFSLLFGGIFEQAFKSIRSKVWRAGEDETGHCYVIVAAIDF
ncbi:hypothetical protein [Mesorhizobium onobrychidis]|uniref:hypothetical protein n=1 Tax=Mesorhizobium onobrychidis TaxID=2775404 RepID=UPI00215867F4|nr:hypothetical protein [Mesorhizobium onobrychidis]